MVRLLASHIMDCFEQNEVLSDKQFGFEQGRGTENLLLLVYSKVIKWAEEGKVLDKAYLDFSKAFD